jgi:phage FluMu protein gp41
LIRLPSYLFFIGGFFSYASIFFASPAISMTMSIIGMIISLYIWYVLARNRDIHLKIMKVRKLIAEENLRNLKIYPNARLWVILYSASFIVMNISGLFVIKAIIDNVDVTLEAPRMEELIEMLGTGYVLFSWVFFLSGIASILLYAKLIVLLYNDEMKIQSLEGKARNIPLLVTKPLSVILVLLFTLVTYGLFSWFMRYRLSSFQKLHNFFEKKLDSESMKLVSLQERGQDREVKSESEELAKDLLKKYSESLGRVNGPEDRKEVIALLFKDLGDLKTDQARSLLDQLLSKELLSENEFNRLIRLLV